MALVDELSASFSFTARAPFESALRLSQELLAMLFIGHVRKSPRQTPNPAIGHRSIAVTINSPPKRWFIVEKQRKEDQGANEQNGLLILGIPRNEAPQRCIKRLNECNIPHGKRGCSKNPRPVDARVPFLNSQPDPCHLGLLPHQRTTPCPGEPTPARPSNTRLLHIFLTFEHSPLLLPTPGACSLCRLFEI